MLSLIPKFALWPFVRPVLSKGLTAIAVGAGGCIARTLDGTSWSEPNSTVTVNLFQAAFGSDTWMIVGASSTVLISKDDGATWAKLALPADITSNMAFGVASIVYDAGRFVIISNDSSMAYTSDLGVTWVRQAQTASLVAFRAGKAKRISLDGAIYQPGGGVGSNNGYAIFKWNGTNYTITSQRVTSANGYNVQASITETKEYLVTVQQGDTSWRRKSTETAWTLTRGPNSSSAMVIGGSATDSATDTAVQVGNQEQTASQPIIQKGIAGTNWAAIDSTVLNAMFGAGRMLSDIGVAGTTSIIVGDNKIFYSTDFTTWSSAFTASKTLNTITVRSRSLLLGDFNRWNHFSFSGNEHIDDVTEKFAVLAGSGYTFADNRMTTTTAASSMRIKDGMLFDANEDFTVGVTITPVTTLNAASISSDVLIAGNCDVDGDGFGTFYILYAKNFNRFIFYVKIAGVFVAVLPSPEVVVPAGTDLHIEFSRKNGQFYVFMNGVKQTLTTVNPGAIGPQPATIRGVGFGTSSASYAFRGSRRGLYIDKGVCRHTESFVPDTSIQTYVRPLYNAEDAKAIRAQFGFRRDGAIDEANDRAVRITGDLNQLVQQGRMKFTSTQSATNGYQFSLDPFGAGDFTIECCFNVSIVGVTSGVVLMAEWYFGTQTNDLNRWALILGPDRKAYFQMNRSAVGTDAVSVTSAVALTLNVNYKVIVERVAGVLNLYVLDAHSGARIDSVSAPCAFPIRGTQPRWLRNYSPATSSYSGTGWIWDMRIADKALYNGVPTIAATMPGMPVTKYTTAEEADIVVQAPFGRSPRDDKSGMLVSPALHQSGYLIAPGAFAWPAVTPAFSAGDFTIEGRFLIGSIGGNPTSLIGQFLNSARNNSWQIRIMDGFLGAVFSTTGHPTAGLVVLKDTVAAVLGQEYYIVIERVGNIVTLYINGDARATATLTGPLAATTLPIQRGDVGSGSVSLRDIRISKTSQYKGIVPKFPQYKQLSAIKPSITMGFFSGSVGTLYGYMENASYSTSSPGGSFISIGSCTHKLFRYTTGGNTIVRRLKGLFMDRGSYLILGWEDTPITPTSDMPAWTNNLVVNGVTFVNASNPFSGFSTPLNGTSIYWSGVTAMNPLQEGRQIAFEFV